MSSFVQISPPSVNFRRAGKYPGILISVLAMVLVGNFLFANFALAQTDPPPAPSASDIKLTKTDLEKASESLEACIGSSASDANSLRYKVLRATENTIKANWLVSTSLGGRQRTSCYLTSADAPEDRRGTLANYRRPEILNFEIRVKNTQLTTTSQAEEGIRPATIVEQIKKNDESKKDSGAGVVSTLIGWVLNSLLKVIASFLGLFTAIAAGILNATLGYMFEVTTMPTVVTVGWTIVRDICNMFFILAFIVMALATILQFETYNYKKILPKLIIMALLVNFSQVIAVTLMNFVNSIAYIFYNDGMFKDIVATIFKVSNPLNSLEEAAQGGALGALTSGLGANAFMLVGVVVFIALAGLFVIRLVGLYVLIIFSPLAFAARILPATEKYSDEWWSHFIKYLIWAPVALFMIRLTVLVVQTDEQFQWIGGGAPDSSFTYIILCAFLFASLLVAKQAGMVGSEMIINGAKAVGFGAPMWAAKKGIGLAGRKWNEATQKLISEGAGWKGKLAFALLNPVATIKGHTERAEKLQKQAQEIAKGAGEEVAASFWTRGKEKLPYKEMAKRKIQREYMKKLMDAMGDDIDKSEAKDFIERVAHVKGLEGENLRGALKLLTTKHGYNDDTNERIMDDFADELGIPPDPSIRGRYNDVSDQYGDWAYMGLDVNVLHSLRTDAAYKHSEEFKNWLKKDQNQTRLRTLFEQTKAAFDVGHYEQGYQAVKDSEGTIFGPDTKGYYIPLVDEAFAGGQDYRTKQIMGEVVKRPIREFWQKITWHNILPKVKRDGQWVVGEFIDPNTGESLLTNYQKELIKSMGPQSLDQMTHAQSRQILYLTEKFMDEYGNITDATQWNAFTELNAGLAEAIRNVRVYGRPRPTNDDTEAVSRRLREVKVAEIIRNENLDDRHKPELTSVYEDYQAGRIDASTATTRLTNVGMGNAAQRIIVDIKKSTALIKAGRIVAANFVPPQARQQLKQQGLFQQFADAAKQGIEVGFVNGSQLFTSGNKEQLKNAIKTRITPILTRVNVPPADIDDIAHSMAKQIDT